jgi:hypothetical protein
MTASYIFKLMSLGKPFRDEIISTSKEEYFLNEFIWSRIVLAFVPTNGLSQ